MSEVWKETIPVKHEFEVMLPTGATVLDVQMQHGRPCIWVLVIPENPKHARRFRLAGTGHPIEDDKTLRHIGTFQMHNGGLVFHLFEIAP